MDMDNLCSALRCMSANFMRVTRGAGAPEALIAQAKDVVFVYDALKAAGVIKGGRDDDTLDVYFSKSLNGYVGGDADVVRTMKAALAINKKEPNAENRIVESFVAAGLRIAAGRQLGDSQATIGESDLYQAIKAFSAAD